MVQNNYFHFLRDLQNITSGFGIPHGWPTKASLTLPHLRILALSKQSVDQRLLFKDHLAHR
jgi:hypothetical protein